jgi:hypothetical protein
MWESHTLQRISRQTKHVQLHIRWCHLSLNKPMVLWPFAHSTSVAEHGWHYSCDVTSSLAQVLGAVSAPSPTDLCFGCSAHTLTGSLTAAALTPPVRRVARACTCPRAAPRAQSSSTLETCTVSPRLPEILRLLETLPASTRILAPRRACRFGRGQETMVGMHGIATVSTDSLSP